MGWVTLAILVAVVVTVASGWGVLALWYRLPGPELARLAAASIFALVGAGTIGALFTRRRWMALATFAAGFAAILIWWSIITPVIEADWAPDVARQVTGTVEGNKLTLTDVRDFQWRSDTDFTQSWVTRTYDLKTLRSLDLFMSYWSGPSIAHVIMSFGFDDGKQLAWSIEVRRREGGAFSPLADLFKSNPLVIVASEERDVVGVRSNVRNEDVQIYRLKASPEAARLLLLKYVADANDLAVRPQFYNSLTTNCTTTIVTMIRAVGDALPFDWRLIVNGYLPEYAYDQGALDTALPLSTLRDRSHVADRARADGLSPSFSKAIRVGVPSPLRDRLPPSKR